MYSRPWLECMIAKLKRDSETASSTEAALGTLTDPAGSTPDVSTETTPIESAPADVAPPPNVQERPKTKGVADIVFLVNGVPAISDLTVDEGAGRLYIVSRANDDISFVPLP